MDALSAVTSALAVASFAIQVIEISTRQIFRPLHLFRLYGLGGLFLYAFGNRTTWCVQAQVLGNLENSDAETFKKSVQDECTMISVAVRTFLRAFAT
jgi:hypothetical protein